MSDNLYFNQRQPKKDEVSTEIPPVKVDLVRTKETGDKVYRIKDGNAYWVTSPEVLSSINGGFDLIRMVAWTSFKSLGRGEPITMSNYKDFIIEKELETVEGEVVNEVVNKEVKTYDPVPETKEHEVVKGLTSIIIPAYWAHYPAFHYTGTCIGSIREHTDSLETPFEIILIVNGKTGIKMDNYKQTYADKVVENELNAGFAMAVNQGIRCSVGEYIVVMNNDVQVYDFWLQDMIEAINSTKEKVGLVMATPMYGMPFARAYEALDLRAKSLGKSVEENFSDFKDFSCAMTKRSILNEVGTFNEDFFMYGEDIDLMRRMEKAGYKVVSTKRVNTHHVISATASALDETPKIMNESKEKLKSIWGY